MEKNSERDIISIPDQRRGTGSLRKAVNGYRQVAMEGDVDGTVNARPDALYLGATPHPLSDSEKDLPKYAT